MPVPFYFDLQTRKFTNSTGAGLTTAFTGKQGDVITYQLAVLNGTAVPLDLGCVGFRLGVKDPKNLSAGYLSECFGEKSGSAQFARWQFDLDLSQINGVFPPTSTSNIITLALELEIQLHGQRIASPLQQFVLEKTMGVQIILLCTGSGNMFRITGENVTFLWLTAGSGPFTLTGMPVFINWLSAVHGYFAMTGQQATFRLT
jgi:hypothetical protein